MKERVVIIVQARMGSERLPGKVMKEVCGRPLMLYVIDQLKRVKKADALVIATSTDPQDLPILSLCQAQGVPCYRGSLDDVLGRYAAAAAHHQADVIVRVCADCPLIDPAVVDKLIGFYNMHKGEYDYVSNWLQRTLPRGQDAEVMSRQALDTAASQAQRPEEREHVTPYLYRHPELFRLGNVSESRDLSSHRWVVDTQEDFDFISRILTVLYPQYPHYSMQDVLNLLEQHPEWLKINAHIQQKGLSH